VICILGFYRRHPELSPTEFSRYWREVRGPLIRDTPAVARHIARYTHHHLPDVSESWLSGVSPLGFDGFYETWFADGDAFRAMLAEPDFRGIVHADAGRFVDLRATRVIVRDDPVAMI